MINTYEHVEQKIMDEVPYNWKKHFIFHIPEILSFCIKFVLVMSLLQFLVATITVSVLSVSLNEFSKEKLQKAYDKAL